MKAFPRLSDFFEPIFYQFGDGYWSEGCPDADKLEHYLISKIRQNHQDLDSHVRRILLNIEFQRKPQLLGALQDLYLVLGRRGESIENDLLDRSRSLLSPENWEHFRSATEENQTYIPLEIPHSYLLQLPIAASLKKNKNSTE